jgi:hypothetical protein
VKAQHTSKTAEHGSPPHIIEHARRLMGGIDLDPASSEFWNGRVRATRYFDEASDGLVQPWAGRVFLNPPSGASGQMVKAFWIRLVEHYLSGAVTQAIWVGFSLEQFVTLQGIGERDMTTLERTMLDSPLAYPTLIPSRRLHYQERKGRARTSTRSENPPHASYVTWLPPPGPHGRFHEECGYLGAIVRTT